MEHLMQRENQEVIGFGKRRCAGSMYRMENSLIHKTLKPFNGGPSTHPFHWCSVDVHLDSSAWADVSTASDPEVALISKLQIHVILSLGMNLTGLTRRCKYFTVGGEHQFERLIFIPEKTAKDFAQRRCICYRCLSSYWASKRIRIFSKDLKPTLHKQILGDNSKLRFHGMYSTNSCFRLTIYAWRLSNWNLCCNAILAVADCVF